MSKSLGNGIDPLEVIDKYGADALRLTLITGNAPGNDMRFYWERVEASRNFANKVWNASRFIMMNMERRLHRRNRPQRILHRLIAGFCPKSIRSGQVMLQRIWRNSSWVLLYRRSMILSGKSSVTGTLRWPRVVCLYKEKNPADANAALWTLNPCTV